MIVRWVSSKGARSGAQDVTMACTSNVDISDDNSVSWYGVVMRMCLELSILHVAAGKLRHLIQTVGRHFYQEYITIPPKFQVVQNEIDGSQFVVKHYYSKVLRSARHGGLNKDGTSRQKKKLVNTAITTGEGDISVMKIPAPS